MLFFQVSISLTDDSRTLIHTFHILECFDGYVGGSMQMNRRGVFQLYVLNQDQPLVYFVRFLQSRLDGFVTKFITDKPSERWHTHADVQMHTRTHRHTNTCVHMIHVCVCASVVSFSWSIRKLLFWDFLHFLIFYYHVVLFLYSVVVTLLCIKHVTGIDLTVSRYSIVLVVTSPALGTL